MTDILEAARTFMESVRAHTDKFLADYRDEHHDDDPEVVDAYCRGFSEASAVAASVMLAHSLRKR